jgi:hypothetical protein
MKEKKNGKLKNGTASLVLHVNTVENAVHSVQKSKIWNKSNNNLS